jgi:RNA polymerase sigma-70 factor (ECF subfamily)
MAAYSIGGLCAAFPATSRSFLPALALSEIRGLAAGCIITSVQRQAFDAEYIQRLSKSDGETERDFVAYFNELLCIKLRSRVRSADQVQDIIQETFLRVLKTLRASGMENPQALGSFVNSVCNNVLFEFYRAQSRFAPAAEDRPGNDAPAESALADEEERRAVRRVIDHLPEKDRRILRWVFFEERDKDEVCRALNIDREYLRVLVHRAKLRFRDDYLRRSATNVGRATPMG